MTEPRLFAALIRHGEYHQRAGAPSAHQPFPLDAAGEAQARAAAAVLSRDLAESQWTLAPVIDSSRLLRAWQTAEIIRQQLAPDARIEEFEALAERGLGSAANLTVAEIETVLAADPRLDTPPPNWKADSRYRLPLQGAESLLEAGLRVAEHLTARMSALRGSAEADTLKLFVGHGAAFRHAAHHLGLLEFEQIARLSMHHARPIYLEYAADGAWRHAGGDWKIRPAASVHRD